ncbi:histidine kinase [Ochrovirga pacifica]|uniref:histidine kinase n=1 Tax=Ochrovirga pacifica TaxID=1042376 RepID=UPI000255A7A6|nr:histidine kinase [Ochrovirga pacifica]
MIQKLVKHIFVCVIIGIVVFFISTSLFGSWDFISTNLLFRIIAFNIMYALVLGFANAGYFFLLGKYKWKEHQSRLRVFVGIVGSIPITLLGLFLLMMFEVMYLEGHDFNYFLSHQKLANYVFGLLISLVIVIIFHAIYFYKQVQERKVKDSQIVARTESAKFESLKSQLDPHFLFNSLNVLTSLIEENPRGAEKFTTGLSKIYRYILEQKDKDVVAVVDELKFAITYMQLLKTRFEEGIEFEIGEELKEVEFKIVPLSLQLLLENAVKHNAITPQKPLVIKIYQENNKLVIKNSFNPKQVLEKSTKVGLENIKQRYKLITKETVDIIQENKLFVVKLPFLTKDIKIMKTSYLNESEKYLRAQKRVDDLSNFYWGLGAYFVVIPFLIFINYKTFWGYQWFWFPTFGWGMGMLLQAVKLFVLGTSWQDKKIREIMEKENF